MVYYGYILFRYLLRKRICRMQQYIIAEISGEGVYDNKKSSFLILAPG
jgi:hypothetical protein